MQQGDERLFEAVRLLDLQWLIPCELRRTASVLSKSGRGQPSHAVWASLLAASRMAFTFWSKRGEVSGCKAGKTPQLAVSALHMVLQARARTSPQKAQVQPRITCPAS
jgi:hypothetical protein